MEQYDVIILGESLIDFVPIEDKILGKFKATTGGAPANVGYGLAKLGNKIALVSRIGNDPLGESIIQTMKEGGVDTSFIQLDNERHTSATIVMPKSSDMLRFLIYRNNSADSAISFNEIPNNLFHNAKILHCGTLIMSTPITYQTTLEALDRAKINGITISVDVNLRPTSWSSQEVMIDRAHKLIELSDIVKMTKEESIILNVDPKKLADSSNKIILITNSSERAEVYYNKYYKTCDVPKVNVVDETGGGDAFTCAFLHYYLRYFKTMKIDSFLASGLRFAVRAGSEVVQRHGAITSLRNFDQILKIEQV